MASSNREASISKTLTYEGGYTNDPRDPGGATQRGITIIDARLYWKHDASPADVKAMPKSVAVNIYRLKYWAKIGCDDRPMGPDFVDFDTAVNSGTGRALTWRKALDVQKLSPIAYVKAQCAKRSSFLHGLRTWSVFGKGWGRRVADVEATGVHMALAAANLDAETSLKKRAKDATAKSGAATTAATASAGSSSILPHLSTLDTSTKVGLCVLGVLVALGAIYFIWHAVQNYHRAEAYNAAASIYKDVPCEPISPTSGPALSLAGTPSPSPSSPPSQPSSTG